AGVAGQVEVFGVGFVEQVVDAGADGELVVDAVGGVEGEDAEAVAVAEVAADHVAFVVGGAVLGGDQPPEGAGAPVALFVGGGEAGFQRRHLRQRFAVVAVAAPGVGEGGVAAEVVGEAVAGAEFGAGDVGVDVIGVGAVAHHAALVGEQDVVVDLADVGGGPGFQVAVAVLAADVE